MAARQPVLGFAFRDGTGSVGTCRFNLRTGTTVAEGHAAGNDLRGLLVAMVGAVPIRQSVVYPFTVDNPGVALPGSLVENRGALIFETSEPGQLLSVSIPAILPAAIQAAGPLAGLELDVTHQAVIDLVSEIINGIWCSPFGFNIVNLASTIVETVD